MIEALREGERLFRQRRFAEALGAFTRADSLDPGEAGTMALGRDARVGQAKCLCELGRPLEALRQLGASDRHTRDHHRYWYWRGRALAAAGEREEAARALERAISAARRLGDARAADRASAARDALAAERSIPAAGH